LFERKEFGNNYGHLSKTHFYLERYSPYDDDAKYKQLPICITCTGRNGLFINDMKLSVGDKQILRDDDKIKLSRNTPLFRFHYKNIPTQMPDCEELKNYYVGDSIGKGGNGQVFITYEIKPNDKYTFSCFALKNIAKREVTGLSNNDSFNNKMMREVDIMRRMKNPHVLELIESFDTPTHLIILIPMMFGGDLLYRIRESEMRRLSEKDSKFFLLQLMLGLNYMHKKGIAHRDIKCDNLLLSDSGPSPILKIGDLGLSKILIEQNSICGTKVCWSLIFFNC
jgi:hypothetical protein